MTAINFPAGAATGAIHTAGGVSWVFDGQVWEARGTSGSFAGGTRLLFQQAVAPLGWVTDEAIGDRGLRVASTSAWRGLAGAVAFSACFNGTKVSGGTALSLAEMPVHNHGVGDPGHTHGAGTPPHTHSLDAAQRLQNGGQGDDTGRPGTQHRTVGPSGVQVNVYGAASNIGIANNGSGAAHTHVLGLDLSYADVIVAVRT